MSRYGKVSQEQIKVMNRINVMSALRNHENITKFELSKMLKLSIPTVTSNIHQLMEEGFVREVGMAESTGGRKPVLLEFDGEARYSIGVNISSTHVVVGLMNIKDTMIETYRWKVSYPLQLEDILESLDTKIDDLCKKYKIESQKILGIGFSLPGLVDEEKMTLSQATNLGIPFYDFNTYAKKAPWPIFIENEANIAAYAEAVKDSAKMMNHIVYISVTEGVGTGIIINGQIYKSIHKKAGEFGHMHITDQPIPCSCGRTGCWEAMASKRALIRYYEEETGHKDQDIKSILHEAMDNKEIPGYIRKYSEYLLVGIENIILGLNPEYVIIGGEIGAYGQMFAKSMAGILGQDFEELVYEGTRIKFSALKDQASLVGAALLAQQNLFRYENPVI